ncbi:MAG: DNA-processing protein DprA [Methylobacter sp.]|jgi:predicted Rossmann fold nucleotide-binding protein DprA/Smf involved in DNA uptake
MNLNENTQAVLLLTSHFTKLTQDAAKPLTPTEWGRFAAWLKEKELSPAQLLGGDVADMLSTWHDSKISLNRVEALLGRGHALALAMEKWQRAGIWVLTRSDENYPRRLKQRLRNDAPPFLFGVGNSRLLNNGGIAVVGSRHVNEENLQYADALGAKAALAGVNVVSGGAKGIDEAAMSGALTVEGTVIGVLADSLLKAATAQKWRNGLLNNNLVLVSPFYPEAGFNVGNAMARNKYVYCLSDVAVVVHSGRSGGTWNGAIENLKKGWVPVWVKPIGDAEAGNEAIVNQGGQWCENIIERLGVSSLFMSSQNAVSQADALLPPDKERQVESALKGSDAKPHGSSEKLPTIHVKAKVSNDPEHVKSQIGFYQLFLQEVKLVCFGDAKSIDEISECMKLHKLQVRNWLEQAQNEGVIKKLEKPVRYQWNGSSVEPKQ